LTTVLTHGFKDIIDASSGFQIALNIVQSVYFLGESLAPSHIDARSLVGTVWLYANKNTSRRRTSLAHLDDPLFPYLVVIGSHLDYETYNHHAGARVGVIPELVIVLLATCVPQCQINQVTVYTVEKVSMGPAR
jgi:hypothetical protein